MPKLEEILTNIIHNMKEDDMKITMESDAHNHLLNHSTHGGLEDFFHRSIAQWMRSTEGKAIIKSIVEDMLSKYLQTTSEMIQKSINQKLSEELITQILKDILKSKL